MNIKNGVYKMVEILENALVVYTDGITDEFAAIYKTKKGIIIGRVINEIFMDCGFISKNNVKKVEGNIRRKVFKREPNLIK